MAVLRSRASRRRMRSRPPTWGRYPAKPVGLGGGQTRAVWPQTIPDLSPRGCRERLGERLGAVIQ